jgi:two-component system, LytTR family, response regulator
MIKAVIIDDEEGARITLNALLTEYCTGIDVIGMTSNVPEGVRLINKLEPDVVFLDIEMPEYNGFELLEFFKEINFEIVFVTAYNQYAIKAFEVSAVDYLLKPVEIDQLQAAILKVAEKRTQKNSMHRLELMKDTYRGADVRKIALPMIDGLVFVEVNDIIYFEADRAYTHIYFRNGSRLTVSKPLRTYEEILSDNPNFFRAHRSNMINMSFISKFSRGDVMITMENGQTISLARDKKQEFEQLMKSLRIL